MLTQVFFPTPSKIPATVLLPVQKSHTLQITQNTSLCRPKDLSSAADPLSQDLQSPKTKSKIVGINCESFAAKANNSKLELVKDVSKTNVQAKLEQGAGNRGVRG